MSRSPRPAYLLALALLTFLLASCSEHREVYTVRTDVTAEGALIRTPHVTTIDILQRQRAAPGPRVFTEGTAHDFGRMDARSSGQHVFIIRNAGEAPLELTAGPSSCKCQLASLSSHHVEPGEHAQLLVKWNTGEEADYSHSASVLTNDPNQPDVRFTIRGTVSTLLSCEPERLTYSRVTPGETPSATTLIFSQVWDAVEFPRLAPSHPGLTWSLIPATADDLHSLHARSAYRLTVTLPPDLPESYFYETIELEGCPAGGAQSESVTYRLGVEGMVLRRLSVYGPEIDVQGTVDMGRVRQGQASHVRLLMKLRDDERSLPVKQIDVVPSFLNVRVEPYRTDSTREMGLYYLHIEVPSNAPTFRLPPDQHGLVRIEFDHPRVEELTLPVDLIIVPRDGV